jgi:hypothetical protein
LRSRTNAHHIVLIDRWWEWRARQFAGCSPRGDRGVSDDAENAACCSKETRGHARHLFWSPIKAIDKCTDLPSPYQRLTAANSAPCLAFGIMELVQAAWNEHCNRTAKRFHRACTVRSRGAVAGPQPILCGGEKKRGSERERGGDHFAYLTPRLAVFGVVLPVSVVNSGHSPSGDLLSQRDGLFSL